MVRPKKIRLVSRYPTTTCFVPENTTPSGTINLSMEGIEAIRLSDFEGFDQETAAQQMGVSRQTYGRVLAEARYIVAEALVKNMRLQVDGGAYEFHGGGRRRRRGRHMQKI